MKNNYSGKGTVQLDLGRGDNADALGLVVSFKVEGWSDPGKCYGPPENCYPPDGEETRTVTGLEFILRGKDGNWITLSKVEGPFNDEAAEILTDALYDGIENADFEEEFE